MLKSEDISIGGFLPFSSIDYPGKLAAVIFCQGCCWRCQYCHNVDLLEPKQITTIEWSNIINFLKTRKKLLDGVVFSGGEPLLQINLKKAILQIKNLGFLIGIHTSGYSSERLEKILPVVDWIGIDIKAFTNSTYYKITNNTISCENAFNSLDLIKNSEKSYEVRITLHQDLISTQELEQIFIELDNRKIDKKNIVVQICQTENILNKFLPPTNIINHTQIINKYNVRIR